LSSTLRRAWLLVNVAITVALLPALFPGNPSGGTAVAAGPGELISEARSAAELASSTTTMVVTTTMSTTPAPPTTVTTAPRVKAAAVAPVRKTTVTTARPRPRPTTTTTAPPKPAAAAPAASGSESGKATWYDYKPGICAHKTLPFGTVVTVHAVNGKSVQCTVGDRGPFVEGYVIDLNQREFEQLAPTSAGRIDVTITW
jgi:rare lipoprotein A (peptidoglycan hydrolase)